MSDTIKATIKSVQRFAEGGLVSAANDVKNAGRGGDDMVVHVNKEEFDEMRARWGEPTINPDTGLPEFFLGKVWDFVKDNLLPAAVGAGVGYLTGGGALSGILGSAFGVNDKQQQPAQEHPLYGGFYNPAGAGAGSQQADSGGVNGVGVLAGLASVLSDALGGRKDKKAEAAAEHEEQMQAQFNAPLPEYEYKREYTGYTPVDYTKEGEREFFKNNKFAEGGAVGGLTELSRFMYPGKESNHYVAGPSDGRADNVDAKLSEGEYVIDAETVALLGNGNNEAGAARLDEMRKGIRAHKGQALAQGEISPEAAHPLQYLKAM